MLLRSAFNAITRIHSRPATLKRPGSPDIFTPTRITPANFFRFMAGPEHTTIRGMEFIIPTDSLYGHQGVELEFDVLPEDGEFKIQFGADITPALTFDTNAATIQFELRKFAVLANAVVTGSMAQGFLISLVGVNGTYAAFSIVDSTLEATVDGDPVTPIGTFSIAYVPWTVDPVRKGDRILDGNKVWSIDEVIEMNDLGASVMGWRVRCD